MPLNHSPGLVKSKAWSTIAIGLVISTSCRAHSLTATILRRVIAVPSAETSNSSEPPVTPPV